VSAEAPRVDERSAPSRRATLIGLAVVVTVGTLGMQLAARWSQHRLGAQVAAAARPGDIQMISSVTCVYCAAARAWFTENRVPFGECLIELDKACADAYRALNAPGTPVMLVRGQRLLGFDAQAIDRALQKPSLNRSS
jgi:glutaredoxin